MNALDEAERFLTEMRNRQLVLGLTNSQFAAYIGVSRQLWTMTAYREKPIRLGLTLAKAALRRFPDLYPFFFGWLQVYEHGKTLYARANGTSAPEQQGRLVEAHR